MPQHYGLSLSAGSGALLEYLFCMFVNVIESTYVVGGHNSGLFHVVNGEEFSGIFSGIFCVSVV